MSNILANKNISLRIQIESRVSIARNDSFAMTTKYQSPPFPSFKYTSKYCALIELIQILLFHALVTITDYSSRSFEFQQIFECHLIYYSFYVELQQQFIKQNPFFQLCSYFFRFLSSQHVIKNNHV
jgi:hypothetical protein